MRACLDRVRAAAMLLDPHVWVRCAVSTETAARHFNILAAAGNKPPQYFTQGSGSGTTVYVPAGTSLPP